MSYTKYYPSSNMYHGALPLIMGTRLDVLLINQEEYILTETWNELEKEVTRLNQMLNRFDEKSDLSVLNKDAYNHPVRVNNELWYILQDCHRYFLLTKGYFDVTLDGFTNISFFEENKSISFSSNSFYIDLGGYAKGYALAQMQKIFKRYNISCALVNFGNSSILTIGAHPQGEYWPIGLQNPYTLQPLDELHLCNQSLSISGNMPSHPKHILNPFTKTFVEQRKMVSVISENPIDAEILTTAFMIIENESLINEIANNFKINKKQIYLL